MYIYIFIYIYIYICSRPWERLSGGQLRWEAWLTGTGSRSRACTPPAEPSNLVDASFFTLVTGPRRSLRLMLSSTRVYEPHPCSILQILHRRLLASAARAPLPSAQHLGGACVGECSYTPTQHPLYLSRYKSYISFLVQNGVDQSGSARSAHLFSWYWSRTGRCEDILWTNISTGLLIGISFEAHCVVSLNRPES